MRFSTSYIIVNRIFSHEISISDIYGGHCIIQNPSRVSNHCEGFKILLTPTVYITDHDLSVHSIWKVCVNGKGCRVTFTEFFPV